MLEENTSCWIQEPRRGKAAVASQPRVQPVARLKAHSPDMHAEHIHTTNVGIPADSPTAHKQPPPKQTAPMRSTHPASLCLSRLEFTGVSIYIYISMGTVGILPAAGLTPSLPHGSQFPQLPKSLSSLAVGSSPNAKLSCAIPHGYPIACPIPLGINPQSKAPLVVAHGDGLHTWLLGMGQ